MIAIAHDLQPIKWQPIQWHLVRRTSARRCSPPPRSLQLLLDGWLIVASAGYLAALLGFEM